MSETDRTTEQEGGSPQRGGDDRRSPVNPAENPAPRSPAPDEEALRKGEDVLERVKPY